VKILTIPDSWRERAIVVTGVTPNLDWFTEDELLEAKAFRRERRRDEWIAGRMAAKHLAVLRGLCSEPKRCMVARPRLLIHGAPPLFASVSHSDRFAAAAIDDEPVGIDVQAVRDLDEKTAKFFLTDSETEAMQRCGIANRLLHFWCAKEAAWKRSGGEPATLKQIPIRLLAESVSGLRFDSVETAAIDQAIAALTRPTS
jgi:phosphopantetheinyl transferase